MDAAVKKPTAAKSKPKAKAKNLAAWLGLSETAQWCKVSVVGGPARSQTHGLPAQPPNFHRKHRLPAPVKGEPSQALSGLMRGIPVLRV